MIFFANFRFFHELLHRTFKTVSDSDYDYPNQGPTVIGGVSEIYLYCGS